MGLRASGLLIAILCGAPVATPIQAADNGTKETEAVIRADIDGNGFPDRIDRMIFQRPVGLRMVSVDGGLRCREHTVDETEKIARFILYPDARLPGRVIFEHRIGIGGVTSREVQLEPVGDLDGDGRADFVFRAADDTSQEIVFLLQKPGRFKAIYTGTFDVHEVRLTDTHEIVRFEIGGGGQQVLSRWNPAREIFEALAYGWITGDCVRIRWSPDPQSEAVGVVHRGHLVEIEDGAQDPGNSPTGGELRPPAGPDRPPSSPEKGLAATGSRPEWRRVRHGAVEGWISTRYLSVTSPTKEFR